MLEVLIPAIVVATLGAFAAFVHQLAREARKHQRDDPRRALWIEAAQEAGLSGVEASGEIVSGTSGPFQVRLSVYFEDETPGTRIQLWSPRLAPGLRLRAEVPGSLFAGRDRKEIEVGDEEFDRKVSVQGPPALALALLDPDTRRAVTTLVRGPFEIEGHRPLWVTGQLDEGVLCVNVPERAAWLRQRPNRQDPPQAGSVYLDGEYRLPDVLRAALALATRLVAPRDLAGRLAANLASEPESGVRRRTLLTLLREFPEAEATGLAVHAARDDADEQVRLRAGIALGAEGREVLLGIAGGEGAQDATSARAVASLGTGLTLGQAQELLQSALRTRRPETAKACMGILARHGGGATQTLAKVLLVEKGPLGEVAAEALAATSDISAEAPLLRALAEGPDGLRRAAATALGRVGTRDAVAPLRELETRDAALRSAARQAIAQIHARLAGAAQGQLSLADGESGRLSLADDERGRLSLSDDAGAR